MMWCSCNMNTNDVMPPHSYVHKWNENDDDIMMKWFALYVNLVMSCLACALCSNENES